MTTTNYIDRVAAAFVAHSTVTNLTIDRTSNVITATVHEMDDFTVTRSADDDGVIHESATDSGGDTLNNTFLDLDEYVRWMTEG